MWWSRLTVLAVLALPLAAGGCTIEPLNAAAPAGVSSQSVSTAAALQGTTVDPVATRVAQQVRNELLFAMHGGRPADDGPYALALTVSTSTRVLATPINGEVAQAAQVRMEGTYLLRERATGTVVLQGRRASVSAYDRTDQLFANKRAERDAQNRAAKDLARRLHLDLAQRIAGI